jgi:hypothetical protein
MEIESPIGSQMVGRVPTDDLPENELPIQRVMKSLLNEVLGLETDVDFLKKRLNLLLSPGMVGQSKPDNKEVAATNLSGRLFEYNNRIKKCRLTLDDLLVRLEV